MSLRSENLANYYRTNFALMQHHGYRLEELDNLIPWEKEIYVSMVSAYVKEQEEKKR